MMRVFGGLDLGPIHVEPRFVPTGQWDAWRRHVRPWLRVAAVVWIFNLLLLWAIVVHWLASNVRFTG
jgi:hypothetical protein